MQSRIVSTSSGRALLRFLRGDSVGKAIRLFARPWVAYVLMSVTLAVLARRRFGAGHRPADLEEYVAAALGRDGSATPARLRAGTATMTAALAFPPRRLVGAGERDLPMTLLLDLVRTAELADEQLTELVGFVERRVAQVYRPGPAIGWRALRWRRFHRELAGATPAWQWPRPEPGTRIGRVLLAMAVHEFDHAAELPDDDGFDGVEAVVGAAVRRLATGRYGAAGEAEIEALAGRAAKRATSPLVTAAEVRLLLDQARDGMARPGDLSRADRYAARIGILMQIVDDLGLLPSETCALLVAAEADATAAGFQPLPA
ncbi:hypothetical protein AB0M46_03965 [Dactylosporangium sp. NPDC051485]|uniref:hypothetical protein n=1 Tax=Dactylosporangium sp. NPDC051485 TaxID=3154846 RepID=UPI00342F2596